MSNETPVNEVFDVQTATPTNMVVPRVTHASQDSAQPLAAETFLENAPPTVVDELNFNAREKITLRCGKSSITLHANGKIVLKGEYILTDAEGINRIAGGHIELN
jgi:hypothetical protein